MNALFLILMLAVVVEALVEYGKSILHLFTRRDYKTAVTQLVAVACSVILCMSADADLFSGLGFSFSPPVIGCLLTGIFASRGANYVSDLAARLNATVKTD